MQVNVETKNYVSKIEKKEINFPYFGWGSSNRDEIVKMDVQYWAYNPKLIKNIYCIFINDFLNNSSRKNPSIRTKVIDIRNIRKGNKIVNTVIDEEINIILRDYCDIATEKEFEDFKEETLKSIFN